MTGVFTIILLGYTKPFVSKWRNMFEAVEEYSIIVIMYHIFCFTDWLPDLEVRHNLGYSIILCMALQLFTILGIMLFLSLRSCILACRRKRQIRASLKKAQAKSL